MEDLVNILNRELQDLNLKVCNGEERLMVSGNIKMREIHLFCDLPEAFPYVFPRIYISEGLKKDLFKTPHINMDLSMCLFDEEMDIPNFNEPEALIEQTIRKAYHVLEKIIENSNQEDILEEFNAYWLPNNNMPYFSNVDFGSKELRLKFYCGEKGIYISQDTKSCIEMAKAYSEVIKNKSTHECIYIPLTSSCFEDDMTSQRDWATIIKNKSNYYSDYAQFLERRIAEKSLIIFSQPFMDKLILSGFLHKKIQQHSGFREGKTPLGLALAGRDGEEEIERIRITDISQKRLFTRGGIGVVFTEKKIGVIGCGSLGSSFAETQTSLGCYKLSLFDKDTLTAENIARHVCGFSYIGRKKTSALKSLLSNHNPNILIETYSKDIHELLSNNIDIFNDNDYLVLTVANAPIENRFVREYIQGKIVKPLIIMWVEPYALAGHALILNKPQDIYGELFSKDMTFKNSIVLKGEKYYKREAGCQATYVPYSGMDVKEFTICVSRFLLSEKCDSNKNYHVLWTGNILEAENLGVELSPKAHGLEEYKSYIERID